MADFGVGEAAAAEGAKSAGEAAAATGAAAGAADVGAAGLGAGLGATAADVAAGSVLADAGATLGGVGASAGLGGGAALGAGELGSATLGSIGAGLGEGIASGAGALGTEAAVSSGLGANTASLGGAGGGSVSGAADAAAAGVGGQAGGVSSASGVPGAAAGDVSGTTASGNAFIPATNSTAPLGQDVMSSLGISPNTPFTMPAGGGVPVGEGGGLTGSFTSAVPDAAQAAATAPNLGVSGLGQGALDFLSKNGLKIGEGALLAKNMFAKPDLSALKRIGANAGTAGNFASPILANGGALNGSQQQQIDSQMNQLEQQGIQQILQNAANSGQGDASSSIVQQRIQQYKQQIETQRQALYQQAQQQNISNALSALGISNQGLGTVAQQQFGQDQQAQAAAGQTASLIGKLNALGGSGTGTPAA